MSEEATLDRSTYCFRLWKYRAEYRKRNMVSEPMQNKILVAVCVIVNQPFFCGDHDRWRIIDTIKKCEARVYNYAKKQV